MVDYIVKSGDTLSSISKTFGTPINDIQISNNIKNIDKIKVGQKLTLPDINSTTSFGVDDLVPSSKDSIKTKKFLSVISEKLNMPDYTPNIIEDNGIKFLSLKRTSNFGKEKLADIKYNLCLEDGVFEKFNNMKDVTGIKNELTNWSIYNTIELGKSIKIPLSELGKASLRANYKTAAEIQKAVSEYFN